MVAVYPLGVPSMYFILLWRKRDKLNPGQEIFETKMSEEEALEKALIDRRKNEEEDPTLKSLAFLYAAYEPKRYYFECFETLRKLALTGFLVFLVPGTAAQIVISMLMCMFSMRVYAGYKPFIKVSNDRFSEVAQWQLYFTMLGALAMKVVSRSSGIKHALPQNRKRKEKAPFSPNDTTPTEYRRRKLAQQEAI